MPYRVLADIVLIAHAAFIGFVVLGLVLTLLGAALGWAWVRNAWFRVTHLACIGVVVGQAWLGLMCPLTVWEMRLRARAGEDVDYTHGFIAYWVQPVVFFDAPTWVFTLAYSVFGLLVVLAWWLVPPRWRS